MMRRPYELPPGAAVGALEGQQLQHDAGVGVRQRRLRAAVDRGRLRVLRAEKFGGKPP